ncbi:MAG: glycosyltransferase family A protein [Candidatus Babeliales bacterium]
MKIKLLLISMLFFSYIYSFKIDNLVPRREKRTMTTSVVVPCVARHFLWLSGMLESYENQTVRPDEVIISISEVEKLNPKEINDLEAGMWSFKLKVIRKKGVILDGDNRTIAMDNASGEILIFSDADDIPHPQRVEIAKFIFENYEVDHILHGMANSRKEDFNLSKLDDLEILKFNNFGQILNFATNTGFAITTGSPCFLRKVGEKIKWEAIKDQEHAHKVYNLFKNNIVLCSRLILYRMFLSSHGNRNAGMIKDILIPKCYINNQTR